MQKHLLGIWVLSGFILPVLTFAKITIDNPLQATTIEALINNVIDFLFWAAVVAVPLMVIIAAAYFLISAGDPKRVQTAKNIILYTIVGLIVILLAKGFVSIITGL